MVGDKWVLEIGDVLNENYKIQEFIAQGGTGEIYKAKNLASKNIVAIKVLQDVYSKNDSYVESMRRELIRDVSDDAIIKYYDLLWTEFRGGFYYLVMEYIEGPSLAKLMSRGPVAEDALLEIGLTISAGLRSAHKAQILHRDISPDNILLRGGRTSGATLIDFGIAKDLRPDARTVVGSGFAGKYEYAAPEQLDGNTDERSDIYALGATLIAAARGKIPELPTATMELYRYKQESYDLADIGDPLRSVLTKMVNPEPNGRFRNANELYRAFHVSEESTSFDLNENITAIDDQGGAVGRSIDRPKFNPFKWLIGGAVFALVLAALWLSPVKDLVLGPNLPIAQPYRFVAESKSATIVGNAPSEEQKAKILLAAAQAIGEEPIEAIVLADGAPGEAWTTIIVGALQAVKMLDDWKISIVDKRLIVTGDAASGDMKSRVAKELKSVAGQQGFDLETRIDLLIADLDASHLSEMVSAFDDCGGLTIKPSQGIIGADDKIFLSGNLSSQQQLEDLLSEVEKLIAGRNLDEDVRFLNDTVCRLMNVFSPTHNSELKFRFSAQSRGENMKGNTVAPTDNPLIKMQIPATSQGYLYSFFVDNEGAVVHLLPHKRRSSNQLADIGKVSDGDRIIQLTYPVSSSSVERLALAFSEPHGVNLVVGLLTKFPMFEGKLRPRVESIDSFAPALARELKLLERRSGLVSGVQRQLTVVE